MAAPGGLAELAAAVRSGSKIPPGPVLVALSGGADSAVLAWVAAQGSGTVRAVFVDHGLKASGQLQEAARQVAGTIGIEFEVVAAPIARHVPSFEDTARRARYAALLAAARPDEIILTGHTADDQAETVLGHFLRGAGAAGLAGIPARRGRLARPLLAVTRAQTRQLARQLALPFADDPENRAADVRRNRLRHELIPQLEATYNPQLRAGLVRSAGVMAADDEVLEAEAARVPVRFDGEVVTLPATLLTVLPAAVSARAVRRGLRAIRGPHAGSHDEVGAVLAVAAAGRAGAELAGGVRVEREGAMVVLSTGEVAPAPPTALEVPSELSFDRWHLTFAVADRPPAPRRMGAGTLALDADQSGPALLVRPAALGDRIDIGTGTKPVRDALAEAGVARRLRPRWPVVAAGDRVAVIPGVRAAAWAWPRPATTRYLVARIDISGRGSSAEGT